jgi:hypothetical protein
LFNLIIEKYANINNAELQKLKKLINSLVLKPLEYLYERTKYWTGQEKLSWLLGFYMGDASIIRNNKTRRNNVDLETSKLSTLLPFIVMTSYITSKPILVRFYLRTNSFAKYKMRAFSHIPNEYMKIFVSKDVVQISKILMNYPYKSFIAGFLDSDGSIQPRIRKRGKSKIRLSFEPEITFYEYDPKILLLIKDILVKNLGIRSNIVFGYKGMFYRLRILSKKYINTLLKEIEPYVLNIERYPKLVISRRILSGKLNLETAINILSKLKEYERYCKEDTNNLINLMNKHRLVLNIYENEIKIQEAYYSN